MNLPVLLAALAMIESGDARHPQGNDWAVGKAFEVSRYQIRPAEWNDNAVFGWRVTNPEHARRVATKLLRNGNQKFRKHRLRDPFPDEIYGLWHRPAAFRKCGYRLDKMPKRVQECCQRFANLVKELEKKP